MAPFLKDPVSGWVFLCLELVPGREVYKLVSPSLKAFLQFTHLSCRPKEPSWAALGMCAVNLGSAEGRYPSIDKVLDLSHGSSRSNQTSEGPGMKVNELQD